MSKQFVITGTDTGIGKTTFAAALTQAVKGYYWKPIQSGLENETDSEIVKRLGGIDSEYIIPEALKLRTPASPHFSAKIDNINIQLEMLLTMPTTNRTLIIEGAGGLFVPLNDSYLLVDLFAKWNIPVIVCARTTLGTINHTLLTLKALQQRNIPIHGIVFIGDEMLDTQKTIEKLSGVKCLGRLPWLNDLNKISLQQAFNKAFSLTSFQSPVWHPFKQHAVEAPFQNIQYTQGAYLINSVGERILDAISSWWVVTHGHCHPVIVKAIKAAAERIDQVIFADYTHDLAEQLAYKLIQLAPTGLQHIFYSDSGSTSIEVAIKMALGFFKHSGMPRTRIVVLEHGYHGDTIGTMSVSERGIFNATYESLLFKVEKLPFPEQGREQITLDLFEKLCQSSDIAALVIEPLILGVGGFKIYPSWVLTELKRIAEKYNTLVIADEVMTGWGRTGTLFACEQAKITPDILCTAKGLTGGSLPLAATLCTSEIFAAHYSTDRTKTFYHSSSYTANPIACAAALANISIWQDEPVIERIQQQAKWHQPYLNLLRDDKRYCNVRQLGTIAAFDLHTIHKGYLADVGLNLRTLCKNKQLLIRPLGNVIYLMMPYCTTLQNVDKAYSVINEAIDHL